MVTRLKQPHVSNSSTGSSSEAMTSLNGDNGRRDTTERRLTKPKSNSGTSLVSQRSIVTAPPIRPSLRRDTSNDTLANTSANDGDEEQCTPPQTSVNDVSREVLPSNFQDIWASVPRPTLRAHYKLHSALGPRWYRNHHLIPPSHFKPSMRPPTFFSPSFPPIGTASHDYPDDDEDPSRSPSHSPLPTPESSQTRVQDGSKPRSRKTSQTAPDAIDMLDLSDPWGQNWHHQSPYEFGQTSAVASLDTTDLPNRARRASFSVARQRSVAPSPLSQSTSAVNLPSLQPEIKHPRKLSKRKTTNVTTIFQDPPPEVDRKATSVPATPIDAPVFPSAPLASDIIPSRMSVSPAGPFMSTPSPTLKREKRGSLLNRLVKKFSTLKRGSEPILGGIEGWNYEVSSTTIDRQEIAPAAVNTFAFPEKPDPSGYRPEEDKSVHPRQEDDRASLSSLEIPYSVMGKLTVVNPDPNEEEIEFIAAEIPAHASPPEMENGKPEHDREPHSSPGPPEPVPDDSPTFPSDAELEMNFDKPLPPRLGTPRFSRLVMSEITVSTPQLMEQPLPPLPPKDIIPQDPPIVRETTRSPSPDPPPEQPESPRISTFDPFDIVNSISLDHTAHVPRPSPTPVQESPKHAPSLRKSASPPKEVSNKPVVERRQTPSPPAAPTVQRDLSGRLPSIRKTVPSPEVTPTAERNTGSLRSVNGHVSLSSREPPADLGSLPSRTRSRSTTRPEPRSIPAAVQIPSRFPVPFPAAIQDSHALHADSPVSTSSILANPPTPYDHRISINFSDRSSTPPAVPAKSVRYQSPPPPRQTGTIKRQTETFKLVRSSSGNVYASSQTILAQGQQWEVVESVEIAKKDRSLRLKTNEKKPRDQERDIDRERERENERELEREAEKQRVRERDSERERQRAREREIELQKEKAREEREKREAERIQREWEIQRERERAKERERREEERIQLESEIQREKERAKERERREAERLLREIELQKEWERTREWERREVEREKERQREKEKEREREHARHREREREKEKERLREKDREREKRTRERGKERERRKEHERREREREKEKERRREKEREKEREREERERRELERARQRKVRSHEEDPYLERRTGHHDRKSRDYDHLKSREYEHRSRDYEPRTDGSEYRSRDEARTHETDRRPTGYDQSSRRESKHPEKPSSRHNEDSRPYEDHRHSRKYDEHHDHRSTRHPTEMSSSSHSQHQPEPAIQPVQIPEPQPVRLERMPSISARPMSQLPSADEMNAVRAKEQWEMERLWKARSLYGLEHNGTVNHIIPGQSSTSSMSDDIPEIDPASPQPHGSSHTAYLVQTPFHDSRPQIYRSMPTAPPPIYYHSPASIPSIPDSLSSYDPHETLRFYPGPAQVAEPLAAPFALKSNNPLPEPPRESPYNPTPLPSLSPSNKRSTEYWTYNGITTAH